MKREVQSTYTPAVLAGIGAFGGALDVSQLKNFQQPVLIASTDGVGTKVKIAAQYGRHQSIGHDIVNHCIDDILVQGAVPLFFLDYFASARLEPEVVAGVVSGISAACRDAGIPLLGGETAEMPGVYQSGEFDLAGTIVGVLERNALLPRIAELQAGDVLVGLSSHSPHTNGYSLIRKIFEGQDLDKIQVEAGLSLLDALLKPHRSYLPLLKPHLNSPDINIKALAHLTGGGFIENIPRVLPEHLNAVIDKNSWQIPPLFKLIQNQGKVAEEEMYRVFNMGIGMVVFLPRQNLDAFVNRIDEKVYLIGELKPGNRKVVLQ
ncbi:MAG: phosphoribosylformylglycinamidine cyclo-ligase [Anaerolineae bacterium]|nr:phosphoribosylformylglycinamidine cyclo-ligase [Anaerolineae bacterium]